MYMHMYKYKYIYIYTHTTHIYIIVMRYMHVRYAMQYCSCVKVEHACTQLMSYSYGHYIYMHASVILRVHP